MEFLKINNTDISQYIKEIKPSHESIWDEQAGRTLTGKFVGDIISRKWKLECTTKMISQTDSGLIMGLLEAKPIMEVSFIPTNTMSEDIITLPFYAGTLQHKVYSYAQGLKRYSVTFDLVEQ